MTTIKEFIEKGAYPKDDKGRALVPMRGGHMATIAATDKPGIWPLTGWYTGTGVGDGITASWCAQGSINGQSDAPLNLLPPRPRKVKVTGLLKVANPRCLDDWRVVQIEGDLCSLPIGARIRFEAEYEVPF
jgi:hypothetical protein